MRPSISGLVVVLVLSWAQPAWGAHEMLYSVEQPVEFEGPGVIVAEVPYITYNIDWRDPAAELLLTVEPNVIGCDPGPQDRNLAAREGIRFVKEPANEWDWKKRDWPRLRGDTLDVLVDLSGIKRLPESQDVMLGWQEDVLTAALWCGLRNARLHWPQVKHVRYQFRGSDTYSHYEGVYALEGIEPPNRFLEWRRNVLAVPGGK